VAFILKLLDQFTWSKSDAYKSDLTARANALHRFIETWGIGFALRNQAIGDRSFQTRKMKEWLDAFVDDEYAQGLIERIKNSTNDFDDFAIPSDELESIIHGGTTHVNVMSPEGGAVTVTSTVGSIFGSKVRGNRTGLIFNNALSLFDLPSESDGSVNLLYPRKRGRSSTCPILVLDNNDNVVMLTGSSGGTRIITTTASILADTLLMGQSATYANSQPRLHTQFNSSLYYDEAMPQEILDILREKGHDDQTPGNEKYPYLGVNQIIDNRACIACGATCMEPCIEAVSDWRKSGKPDGY
jgi:gamma-glutamyltranspeptidase/glutathione hydrolase/leukotriene-C4 hydrolase